MKKKIIIFVILIPLFLIGNLFFQHYRTRDGISVVGYHGVVSDQEKQTVYADNCYYLSESQFRKHLQYLAEHQYQTLSMQQVEEYYNGEITVSKKAVALTFDDGYKNFNTVVKPILEEYGFQGTCFVIGKHVNDDKSQFLKADDLINTDNVQYYAHSYNLHRKASGIDRKIIQDLSLEEIENDFEVNPVDSTYFAYPYGRYRNDIDDILIQHNVHLAFSYNQFRHLTRDDDQYRLPRYMIVDMMPDFYIHWIFE